MMSQALGAAVLGTGDVSGEHIKAFQANPHTEVRGILSRDRARAEAKASEYGLLSGRAYTDLDDLLKADDIHVVSICTPHDLRVEQGWPARRRASTSSWRSPSRSISPV